VGLFVSVFSLLGLAARSRCSASLLGLAFPRRGITA